MEKSDENRPVLEERERVNQLLSRIREVSEVLDADHLNERELRRLSSDATLLAEIVKRDLCRKQHELNFLAEHLDSWEEEHREGITRSEFLPNDIATLKTHIDQGNLTRKTVDSVLNLAENLLSLEARQRETEKRQQQATVEKDYATVRSLTDELESIQTEWGRFRAHIAAAFGELPTHTQPVGGPDAGNRSALCLIEAAEAELSTKKSESPYQAPATKIAVETQAAQEPETNSVPTSGTDDEPVEPDAASENSSQAIFDGRDADDSDVAEASSCDLKDRELAQRMGQHIVTAIKRGFLGVAYHLARSTPGALPSAQTVKLVSCNYVNNERMPLGAQLLEVAAELLREAEEVVNEQIDQRSCLDFIGFRE